ncbi:MAG TPA: aspartate/glutamate racemase family protein [Pseudolabrys sp.]|nr:aspartate/glutamate racemase family protein [Pseudolabrys sp.]
MNAARKPGRCLGLIGGLGPGATVHYYQQLVAAHEQRGRTLRLLIAHADIKRVYALVTAKDLDGLARYLAGLSAETAAGGAELTAIVAATPHICASQLGAISPLPLIDMLAEVRQAVNARGLKRVALLGTRFTIETRLFGCLEGIETVMPDAGQIETIQDLYKEFVEGRGSDVKTDELRRIARAFVSRDGAQSVLIAGTDLSNVLTETNAGFPMIDCARVHIDAIVRRLLD